MKRKQLQPLFDELIPLLVHTWRKFLKIPFPKEAPTGHLMTREFRSCVKEILKLKEGAPLSSRESIAAYMLYYFPLRYAEGLSLINELPILPHSVLDLYSGPAPFSLAALQAGATDVLALDQNQEALHIGAEVIGRLGYAFTQRVWKKESPLSSMTDKKYDLVISAYAPEILPNLFDFVSDDGYLLVVEESWPAANKRLLNRRQQWLNEGYHIIAPCIYQQECPALARGFACYAQREFEKPYLLKEIQRAASINLSSLKMSYLILSKKEVVHKESLHRVVSPALTTRFGKRYMLCGDEGFKMLGSRLEEPPRTARAFNYLSRGDLIHTENTFDHLDNKEVIESSSVEVRAAVSKPIPI